MGPALPSTCDLWVGLSCGLLSGRVGMLTVPFAWGGSDEGPGCECATVLWSASLRVWEWGGV